MQELLPLKKKKLKENERKYKLLEQRIRELESEKNQTAEALNKQERFSRRSNIRIVGYPTTPEENCIDIAKKVLEKVGIPDASIERAHRDGARREDRNRHLLVRLSFFQDKITALRNQRKKLKDEGYFITDDLTFVDLSEKRKWKQQVAELYANGTKLRFFAGKWRGQDGGDFSFVFNFDLDKKNGVRHTNFKAREECLNLMTHYNLVDIWRNRHPLSKQFTWKSSINDDVYCRLDFFFLISNALIMNVIHDDLMSGFRSDHSFVFITTSTATGKRGPGFWKFNNSLLENKEYVNMIQSFLNDSILNVNENLENPALAWDYIKYDIRKITIKFSKILAQNRRRRERNLNKFINSLERQLFVKWDLNKNSLLKEAQNEMLQLYNFKLKGIQIRSRARWVEDGEKNSKYFLNLEKKA
ncbi:hypothetical protein HOLleu_05676 [Holothuria leucospilota]|uniref:Uncharacterized protein n=1 Tax=Holothuria leucospilota TaxID=206669 RepID=A0A9Q1CLR9_HOLLE|nr:hypothetical protein HOLleu_05676 [Holothuria leucospilota]